MKKIFSFLDVIIYWLIILIPFSVTIAPAAAHTFIGMLIFFFVLKKILKKQWLFAATVLNLPISLLFLASFLSFKNTISLGDSFHGMLKLLQNVSILLICAEEIRNKNHVIKIVASIILGASFASFDAFWQLAFGKDIIRGREVIVNIGLKRLTASFPTANALGVYLSATVPLVVGLTLFYFKGKAKALMLIVSALVTGALIFTFSRGTGLGFYFALLFICIVRKNKFFITSLIALFLIFPLVMPKNIKEWAKSVHYNPIVFLLNADRISIYRNSVNMLMHYPILGVGVNTYCANYSKYKLYEPPGAETASSMYAHNSFLQMVCEIGFFGLGIFLWFLYRLFKLGRRAYVSLGDEYLKIVCLCVAACLTAFLINGMTETSLYYGRLVMMFWLLAGVLLSMNKFTNAAKP